MARYKSEPKYMVRNDDIRITFDYAGEYETDNAAEIKILDGLVPRYMRKVDDESPRVDPETKPDEKSESKPESTPKNKSGGKSGGRAKSSGK